MHKIFIIARREYLERVRTRSFVVTTVLIPLLLFGATAMPVYLESRGSAAARHLLVVAPDISTAQVIRQQLERLPEEQKKKAAKSDPTQKRQVAQIGPLTVDLDTDTSEAARAAATEKVKQKELDGVIFATKEALSNKKIPFITRDVSNFGFNARVEDSVNEALERDLLRKKGLTDAEVNAAVEPVELDTRNPSGTGNARAAFIAAFSMVMLLYATVMWYGVAVTRAILDEKTSRVMEVMLSTARPTELMAGKVLGVGAVGLTQVAIWVIAALLVSSPGLIAGADTLKGIISLRLLVSFAVFFLLGYTLYSTLCAAVGSIVNSEQEAQQLQIVVMMPMIISVIIMVNVVQNPGAPSAVWASLFPLTAPLLMFLRIAMQPPPWWQIAISIGLMVATIYGLVWACARIYRIGILMYGKRPTLPEIMKWIRYA